MAPRPTKRLDHGRDAIRFKPYALHTAHASVTWLIRSRFCHDTRYPTAMGRADIEAVLTHLAGRPALDLARRVSLRPAVE